MCGIVGVINIENKRRFRREIISRMNDKLFHRGPDSEGVYVDDDIAFGHRRLKIIDLTERGNQPLFDKKRRCLVVFNGEIYNYKEIRDDLLKKGYKFVSNTDTEVLINAYLEYGLSKALQKFNGMFAFALKDLRTGEIYIVRDRLGIKPLYYSFFDGRLIFSSEIKAILSYPDFPVDINYEGLKSYFYYRYPVGELSLYENIKTLMGGYYIKIYKSKVELKKYWELPIVEEKIHKKEEKYLEEISDLLRKSVKYRLISDVPVGAYLSGGLDSSYVVAMMSKYGKKEHINTFSIGFEESKVDESYYSELVSKMFKTNHHPILISGKKYFQRMEEVIRFKDAPVSVPNEPAILEMSYVLKNYITVVLSGEGADEIFGGYGRIFRSCFDYMRLNELKNHKGNNCEVISEMLGNMRKKYADREFNNEIEHFLFNYKYISDKDIYEMFEEEYVNENLKNIKVDNVFFKYFDAIEKLDICDKYMWIFEKLHLPGLLFRLDTNTMAVAVEARVPFVDHNLVEYMQKVPFSYKIKWKSVIHEICAGTLNSSQISEEYDVPKYLLKKSAENILPKEVVYRKKMGFPIPLDKWLKYDIKEHFLDYLYSSTAKQRGIYNYKFIEDKMNSDEISYRDAYKLWSILNMEIWLKNYIDRR